MSSSEYERFLGCSLSGFRLTHFLGSGGTALVFRGENLVDSTILRAIKVVRPELSAKREFRLRFAEEARTLERLTHGNVVRFFGLRESDGYLVMELELLAGAPLAEMIGVDGPPDVSDVVGWFTQVADGVAAAHAIGIVHRDLKPENLFLTEGFVAKVLDFGIARARDEVTRAERATVMGTTPGTPAYIAPEVWNGAVPGEEADIYALGVSLWEVLAGHHPFAPPGSPPKGAAQLMYCHLKTGVPSARDARPEVPESLDSLIAAATTLDPEHRLASARHLAASLRAIQAELTEKQAEGAATRTQFALPQFRLPAKVEPRTQTPKVVDSPSAPVRVDSESAVVTRGRNDGGRSLSRRGWFATAGLLVVSGALVTGYAVHKRRAGEHLAVASTGARPAPLNRWVKIPAPAEPWLLGVESTSNEPTGFRPEKRMTFAGPTFEIHEHEVTWEELEAWAAPDDVPAKPKRPTGESPKHPAISVAWRTASAFCEALGGALPNERQWEFAARGAARRKHPWGEEAPDPLRTRAGAGSTLGVRRSLQDQTPEGVFDLAGNAEEWTADIYEEDVTGRDESWAVDGTTTFRTVRGRGVSSKDLRRVSTAVARRPVCATGACEKSSGERKLLLRVSTRLNEPLPPAFTAISAAISAAEIALIECASHAPLVAAGQFGVSEAKLTHEDQTLLATISGKAQPACLGSVYDYGSEYECIQNVGKEDLVKPTVADGADPCLKAVLVPLLTQGPNGAPRRWKGQAAEQWTAEVRVSDLDMSSAASRDIGFRCVRPHKSTP